jgi:hypothetical protein
LRPAHDRNYALWEHSSNAVIRGAIKEEIVRRIVESLLIAAGLALALAPAHGDNYPSRRITLIAPWPPAGAIDTTCRELAPGVGTARSAGRRREQAWRRLDDRHRRWR